jgi:hypothetical protein
MDFLATTRALARRFVPVMLCTGTLLIVGAVHVSPRANAGTTAELVLDLDVSGGACATIDATRSVPHPTTGLQIAVCFRMTGNVDPVAAFQYAWVYDDSVIVAPELPDTAPALDDNPNANEGNEISTPGLGSGWDCAPVGVAPVGDTNPASGAGNGRAFSGGCASTVGATLTGGAGFAPLGVISFNTVGGGTSTIVIDPNGTLTDPGAEITGDSLDQLGSCSPVVTVAMTCTGGTITVTGAPTSTPVPTINTPTPTNTPAATSSAQPTKVNNTSSDTPTPSPTGEATAAPGTEVPAGTPPSVGASPTRTGSGAPGAGVTGPDTGSGPDDSGGLGDLMLLVAAGGVFLATGGAVAWSRSRIKDE